MDEQQFVGSVFIAINSYRRAASQGLEVLPRVDEAIRDFVSTFYSLMFKIEAGWDCTTGQFRDRLKEFFAEFKRGGLTSGKYAVFVFVGHGGDGDVLYMEDGKTVTTEEVVKRFAAELPKTVLKMFFIDACRKAGEESAALPYCPAEAKCLLARSALPYQHAWTRDSYGVWSKTLSKQLLSSATVQSALTAVCNTLKQKFDLPEHYHSQYTSYGFPEVAWIADVEYEGGFCGQPALEDLRELTAFRIELEQYRASQVLKKYEDEFFEVVNAKISLRELKRKNVISDSLMLQIESAYSENAKEQLYDHLRHNADVATLRDYCKMLIAADGYPKMQKLGERMLYELPPTEAPDSDLLKFGEHYSKVISSQATVALKITKCTTIGPPCIGKTCFKHLLTGQEWDVETGTVSTDVMEAPEWVECYRVEEGGAEELWRLLSKERQTGNLLRAFSTVAGTLPKSVATSSPPKAVLSDSTPSITPGAALATGSLPKAVLSDSSPSITPGAALATTHIDSTTAIPTDPLPPCTPSAVLKPRTLMKTLKDLACVCSSEDMRGILKDKEGEVLGQSRLIHFIDTGGQAIYHDVHPVLITSSGVYLVVCSLKELYQKHAKKQLDYFRSDLIQRPLRSIYTFGANPIQEKDYLKPYPFEPKIFIVGTHLDQIPPDEREEFLSKVHKMISDEIGNKPYRQFVQYDCKGRSFWAVDNTQAGKQDKDVETYISALHKKAEELEMSVKVPLSWMLLKLVMDGKRLRYCKYSELRHEALLRDYVREDPPDADLDSMLRLFHVLGLIYHRIPRGYTKEDSLVFIDPDCLYSATSDFLMAAKEKMEDNQQGSEEHHRHWVRGAEMAVSDDAEYTKAIRQLKLKPRRIVSRQDVVPRMEGNVESIMQEVDAVLQKVVETMSLTSFGEDPNTMVLESLLAELKKIGQKYQISCRDRQEDAVSLKDTRQMFIHRLIRSLASSVEAVLGECADGSKGGAHQNIRNKLTTAVANVRAQCHRRSIDSHDMDQFLSILSDLRIVANVNNSGFYVVPAALPKMLHSVEIAGTADPILITVVSQTIMKVCYLPSGLFCCLISELVTGLGWTVFPFGRTHIAFGPKDITGMVHMIEHESYIEIKLESEASLQELMVSKTCQTVKRSIHESIARVYVDLCSSPTIAASEEALVWGFHCEAHPSDKTHIAALQEDDSDCCAECLLIGSLELQPVTPSQLVWTSFALYDDKSTTPYFLK